MARETIRVGKRLVAVEKTRKPFNFPGSNKGRFGVVSTERRTVDGHTFDSMKEAKRFQELCLLERAGAISDLELQPTFPVTIGGQHFCKYSADFLYIENGKTIAEDVKSSGTAKDAAYRLRRKAAILAYPNITFTEVLR